MNWEPCDWSTAFLLLGSSQVLLFSAGMLLMGVAHAVIAFKGTHLASHGALSESQAWGNFWAVFFIEVSLTAEGQGSTNYCFIGFRRIFLATQQKHDKQSETQVRSCGRLICLIWNGEKNICPVG